MYKQANVQDEIYRSMETSLIKNQTEETYGINKLAKAIDYLNDAAVIFERAGMMAEAVQITQVLQDLAKDLK